MPKILKKVTELRNSAAPNWWFDLEKSPTRIPYVYPATYALGDDGIVYIVTQEYRWVAYRWFPDGSVTEKENIWHAMSKGRMSGDVGGYTTTKKALVEAIENGSVEWHEWDKKHEEPKWVEEWADRCGGWKKSKAKQAVARTEYLKKNPSEITTGDVQTLVPKWFWYLAAAVVVAVGIAILTG